MHPFNEAYIFMFLFTAFTRLHFYTQRLGALKMEKFVKLRVMCR